MFELSCFIRTYHKTKINIVPQQQTLSYIQRDLSLLRTQQPRLGLELWQIFLGLTLILSIASGLMWFNSLAPHNKKLDFLFIDSTKSSLFTSTSSLDLLFEEYKDTSPLEATLSGVCYSNIAELNINPAALIEPTQKSLDIRLEVETFKRDIPARTSLLADGIENLYHYLEASDSYSLSVYNYYQTKIDLHRARLEIQKQVSIMCQSDFGLLPSESTNLKKVVSTISNSQSSDYITDWLNVVKRWNTNSEKINSYDAYIQLETAIKDELTSDFVDIFQKDLKPITDSLVKSIDESQEHMRSSLEQLETWQQKLQKNDAMYKDIAVYTQSKKE